SDLVGGEEALLLALADEYLGGEEQLVFLAMLGVGGGLGAAAGGPDLERHLGLDHDRHSWPSAVAVVRCGCATSERSTRAAAGSGLGGSSLADDRLRGFA